MQFHTESRRFTCRDAVSVPRPPPPPLPPAALLDLPVQPGASEVLGFGQPANASPSALPFRFYEQSRRAPNDPTASRPVFASVDKVPGDVAASALPASVPGSWKLSLRNPKTKASSCLSPVGVFMATQQKSAFVNISSALWMNQ